MSRLSIITQNKAQATVEELYKDVERRISASPSGLCPVDMASSFLKMCHAQSCGKCVPCRIGLGQLEKLLDDVLDGNATLDTIDLIEKTAGISSSYRTDCWYHHAYKVKLYQAYTQDLYETETDFVLEPTAEETSYFVKAVQADGQTGWGSPIWVQKG